VGNWLEVYESIKILNGEMVKDLYEVSLNLSGAMIFLGGKANSIEEGFQISEELIKNGKAFDKFLEMVKLQKGDTKYLKNPNQYPAAKYKETIVADKNGYLKSVNNYQIGMASLELGAGRLTKNDRIDPSAGIIFNPKIGNKIKKGDVIAELHTNNKLKIDEVKSMIIGAIAFSSTKVKPEKLIKKIIN
ncbi:MAG: thymidine phosphorylase, partial [Ignavibacteriae bacterium]|nr:thymidine phosphorylase [Ignavibacteriota bacterium]